MAILPLFILLRDLGLLDNPLGVILPAGGLRAAADDHHPAAVLPEHPRELEEAAAIDGCSPFGFFWRVLLPLARPALATVSVLALVASWNKFLLPLVVLQRRRQLDAAARRDELQGRSTRPTRRASWRTRRSPSFRRSLFYVVAERQLVGGLTAGAVKG